VAEPISIEEFQAAVKSIKTHIDGKFEAHEELEALRHEVINKFLAEHHTTLYGKPGDDTAVGLRIKVDRLTRMTKAVSVAVVGALTAAGSYLGLR